MYKNVEELYYQREKEIAMEGFIDLFMHDNKDKNKLRKFDMYYVKKYLKSAKEIHVVNNLDEIYNYYKERKPKTIQDIVNLIKEYDSIAGPMLYKVCVELNPKYNPSKDVQKLNKIKDSVQNIIKTNQPKLGTFIPYTGDRRVLLRKLEMIGIDYFNDNLNNSSSQNSHEISNVIGILYGTKWNDEKRREHWNKIDDLDGDAYNNFQLLYEYGCKDGDDGGGGIPNIDEPNMYGITGADCVLIRRK